MTAERKAELALYGLRESIFKQCLEIAENRKHEYYNSDLSDNSFVSDLHELSALLDEYAEMAQTDSQK